MYTESDGPFLSKLPIFSLRFYHCHYNLKKGQRKASIEIDTCPLGAYQDGQYQRNKL